MSSPVVLMVVSDLLMRQTVDEALRAAGYETVGAAGIERMRLRLAERSPVAAVIDLETARLDVAEAVAELERARVPSLGFAGHTDVERLRAARAAGCRKVVTRGEVAARLGRLVTELVAGSATVSELT